MRIVSGFIAAGAASLLVACANPQASLTTLTASDPAAPYIGMTRAEIIACAGNPHARIDSGANSGTLTYRYSGAGPVPGTELSDDKKEKKGMFGGGQKKEKKDWTCTATLAFENDRLVRVHYAHKDMRGPYDWQGQKNPKKQEEMRNQPMPTCTFSLPRCRQA